jgi:NifB/MoaA-like Fe-S oxidoreductase
MKNMIYMCLELEKLEVKSFQFFPLRTNIAPKYIPIDTKSIIEILINKEILKILGFNNENELKNDITGCKHKLWSYFFNLKNPIFYQKKYSFDYRILTDCFGVSIQLIHNDLVESSNLLKINRSNKKRNPKFG